MLAAYAAGIGIPFLLTADFFSKAGLGPFADRAIQVGVSIAGGVSLVVMGLLMLSGKFALISLYMQR